jgi:hypothetical protein
LATWQPGNLATQLETKQIPLNDVFGLFSERKFQHPHLSDPPPAQYRIVGKKKRKKKNFFLATWQLGNQQINNENARRHTQGPLDSLQ